MEIAIFAIIGAVTGASLIPFLANRLLQAKYRELCSWWDESATRYEEFLVENDGRAPSSKAKGEEGALGIWAKDVERLYTQKALTHQQFERLLAIGFDFGEKDADIGYCTT